MNKINFTSFTDGVLKDIRKAEKRALTKVGRHMVKEIRHKIDQVGIKKHTGHLKKGIAFKVEDDSAIIGYGPPAQHAHLVEMGTKIRHTKTGKVTGYIKPTPILIPTFEEQRAALREILEDRWL